MIVRGSAIFLCLLLGQLTVGVADAQTCTTERRNHCSGVQSARGTDEFAAPANNVLRSFPDLQVSGTGIKPSSARVVGNPIGQPGFQVFWETGVLSCVQYTVKYCYAPR